MQKSGFPKLCHYVGFWQIGSHIVFHEICKILRCESITIGIQSNFLGFGFIHLCLFVTQFVEGLIALTGPLGITDPPRPPPGPIRPPGPPPQSLRPPLIPPGPLRPPGPPGPPPSGTLQPPRPPVASPTASTGLLGIPGTVKPPAIPNFQLVSKETCAT